MKEKKIRKEGITPKKEGKEKKEHKNEKNNQKKKLVDSDRRH